MKNVHKPSTSIKNWSADDRPMEKIIAYGSSSLSNAELLAILIRTGNRKETAVDLSRKILQECDNDLLLLGKKSTHDLQSIKGIGMAKSMSILAALELGRRRNVMKPAEQITVRCSSDVVDFLSTKMQDLSYEIFGVVYLNRANKIVHFETISKGGITGTVADPRIILKLALQLGATSMILSHNHPSGNLKPSKADEDITVKITAAAQLMDIKVLDHLIISDKGYFSFLDEGLI